MPEIFKYDDQDVLNISEFKRQFLELKCKSADPNSVISAVPLLQKLGNNKNFVFDAMRNKLLDIVAGDRHAPDTGQVLGIEKIDDFFSLRAVMWPAKDDEILTKTGSELFYYDRAHDHNFSFLTIGYWGPGYVSDYYEIDIAERGVKDLHVGEKVSLKHTGLHTLTQNTIMLYRAYVDIHSQMYPESMSISLNIIANPPINAFTSQYLYDTKSSRVNSLYQSRANYGIFRNALECGIDDAEGMLLQISKNHQDGLTRYFAVKALADHDLVDIDSLKYLCDKLKCTDKYSHGMLKEYLRPL